MTFYGTACRFGGMTCRFKEQAAERMTYPAGTALWLEGGILKTLRVGDKDALPVLDETVHTSQKM